MGPSRHSEQEKLAIVNEWLASGESADDVAERHGIHSVTLRKWRRNLIATDQEAVEDPSKMRKGKISKRDVAMAARDYRQNIRTIEDAAERWGCSADDIQRFIDDEAIAEAKRKADDAERARLNGAPVPGLLPGEDPDVDDSLEPLPPPEGEPEPPKPNLPASIPAGEHERIVSAAEMSRELELLREENKWLRSVVRRAVEKR